MTPDDLITLCKEPMVGLDGKSIVPKHIYLTLTKKSLPRDRVRLAGRCGPFGKVCNAKRSVLGFSVVAVFNRKDIINFLEDKQGVN